MENAVVNNGAPVRNLNTFCTYAFYHINLRPDGKAALCCRAASVIQGNGRELSLHHDTFDDIWNSSHMIDVRRRMVSGEPVPACAGCYQVEHEGGNSLRSMANQQHFMRGTRTLEDIYDDCRKVVVEHGGIAPSPRSIHFWFGNLCNLKCRMCSPFFSSQIAADPEHARWSSGPRLARTVRLLPDRLTSVVYHGFQGVGKCGDVVYRLVSRPWDLRISLAGGGDPIEQMVMSGFKDTAAPIWLRVAIGTHQVFNRVITRRDWHVELAFSDPIQCLAECSISLRFLGVPSRIGIRDLSLKTAPNSGTAYPREIASRLPENPNWFDNDDLLLKEILKNPEGIGFLSFAGGEPLINPKLEHVLRHFVDRGLAKRVSLYFATNGTVRTPKIFALLKEFKCVHVGVSVDGVGPLQEYIRAPSKWDVVSKNLLHYRAEGLKVAVHPTAHVYNLFGLLDLVRFCDQHKMDYALNNVLCSPPHLSFDMLPQALVDEALAEWSAYRANECRPHFINEVDTVMGALKRPRKPDLRELQKTFVQFTSDIDKARGQSLQTASPRLYQRLLEHDIAP